MSTTAQLPRWRLDTIFSELDARDFHDAVQELQQATDGLSDYFEKQGVTSGGQPGEERMVIEQTLVRFEEILRLHRDLLAYLQARIDTNAYDDAARAEKSRLQPIGSRLAVLGKRFSAWIGGLDLERAIGNSEIALEHRYTLERYSRLADHLMGPEAEELAAVMDNTGASAWAQLHSALISRGTIQATIQGLGESSYNVAELKQLQYDPDREVRRSAFLAELELLGQNEVPYAAAMNSIKGQVGELALRRGWTEPLEESLFTNAMSRASLDALQQACRESFPVFRRYLKAKASFLGLERLAWYDLFAPVAAEKPGRFDWDETRSFVIDNFATYSQRLASFAQRSFDDGWMDVPSLKGKVNGAYCMAVPGRKESRILLNFGGKLDDVFTVAHELGHAFHNDCMYRFDRTNLQRTTPMTLSETASIFCETLVLNALLENSDDRSRLAILEQDLVSAAQLVLDIDSRFRFEHAVFARRRERELSVDEMKEIMLEAQAATYGEGVEPESLHPLMWAHKGHYYSSTRSYYNYPYTFGLLFGLGLFRVFRDQPTGFQDRYERLLASTGMKDAAVLAADFGIDIEDVDFWRDSLAVFEERVAEYERLVKRFTERGS